MCCCILVLKKCIHHHNYSIYIIYTVSVGGERWHFSSYLKDYGGIGSAKCVYFGDALTGPLPARCLCNASRRKIDFNPILSGAQRRDASGMLLSRNAARLVE